MHRREKWKQKLLRGMTVFLLTTAGFLILPSTAPAATRVVVTGDTVNVRSGPATTNNIVAKVKKNDQFTVLDARGDWYKISVNGVNGWIAGWLVRAEKLPDKQATITATTVNVRSGPGTSYGIVSKVYKGGKYNVTQTSGQWLKISLPNGQSGWIAGWLASVSEVEAKAEPANPAPPAQNQTPTNTSKVKEATITASTVNVRSGPGTSYGIVSKVYKGGKYDVTQTSGQWLKITLPNGQSGWIAGWLASVSEVPLKTEPAKPAPPAQNQPSGNLMAVVNGDNVNVRGGPGTSHGVLSQVSRGQRLGVLERTGDWYKVRLDGGVIGWVAGWLINVEQAEASPAPGDPPVETGDTDRSDRQQPGEPVKLEKIEVNNKNGHTLVTLKASGELNYDMFLITNPDRLVVDLKNIEPGDLPETIPVGTEVVNQIRTGWFSKEPPVLRVVFDLKGAVVSLDKLSEDRRQLDLDIYIPAIGSFLQGRVIAIDPGHGGKDPGAIGPTGLQEKDVTLDIALKLAQMLTESGARVVLTRTDDRFIDLYERTAIAEANGAEVFLSIHINANSNPNANGISTYYRRDYGDLAPGVNQADNRRLAGAIQTEILRALGRRSLGVLQANFVVLRTSPVPAALAEIAFISNPEEEQMLRQENVRIKVAEALARGLNNYFSPAN
jgi:N-acetylmuramoyl-L-alanine amidase